VRSEGGGKGHFQSGSASIADNGDLVATFTESGVGKSPTTYHLQAKYDAVYTCGGVVWGFISGGALSVVANGRDN
jgi:hypothetical protein